MTAATSFLSHLDAAGLALIGLLAVAGWIRHRGTTRACLAAALGLLGLVSGIGQVTAAAHPVAALSLLSLLCFMASGYALVELRHHLIPLRAHVRPALLVALAATTLLALPSTLTPSLQPGRYDWVIVTLLILEWTGCVAEPAIRFWMASRGRPAVQRNRLRALSGGYLGIAIALDVALGIAVVAAALSVRPAPVVGLPFQVVATAVIPLFYVGFAPPGWLRHFWLRKEAAAYQRANDALMGFSEEPTQIATLAVEWATRFVGASAGLMRSGDGAVLASTGMGPNEAAAFMDRVQAAGVDGQAVLDEGLIVVPVRTADGHAMLAVSAGPFSPFFGGEELRTLKAYANSIALALDRVRLAEELRHQSDRAARLDPLTSVANRRAWQEQLQSSIETAARTDQPLCIAILDLDNFKDFNDDWGHQRGDRLLIDVAQGWKHALRDSDFLARYGGDEFSVILPGCTAKEALDVLQRMSSATPEHASIGLAQWDREESADELVARADAALLRSKRERRGNVTIADHESAAERFTGWSRRIDDLLERRYMTAAYQPIVALDSRQVFGYEALLRIAGSSPGSSVEELFMMAQRLGYSRSLDWLGRRTALECAAPLPDGALLFVNVSSRALLDPVHDTDQMLMLLRWVGRRPHEVVLEISEREIVSNLGRLHDVLADYRAQGFRFALDDVGEGHSTLEVLIAANAEFIKIARSLTEHVDQPSSGAAVRAIVTFAGSTGAVVVAEGVSRPDMVGAMRKLGVRYGQGYELGRPVYFDAPAVADCELEVV